LASFGFLVVVVVVGFRVVEVVEVLEEELVLAGEASSRDVVVTLDEVVELAFPWAHAESEKIKRVPT
jgi:hypothetical protein